MLLIVSNVFITVSFGAPYYLVFDSCIAFTLLSLLHSLAVGNDSSRADSCVWNFLTVAILSVLGLM